MAASAGNFNQDFDITWGDGRAKILNNGELLTLSLDKTSDLVYSPRMSICLGRSICSSNLFLETLLALSLPIM